MMEENMKYVSDADLSKTAGDPQASSPDRLSAIESDLTAYKEALAMSQRKTDLLKDLIAVTEREYDMCLDFYARGIQRSLEDELREVLAHE